MSDIAELADIGTIFHKLGEEIRVTVKDSGHGPRIDARIMATGEGTRMTKRNGRWVEAPAYCGPTKAGLWMTTDQAAQVAVLLEQAVDAAELIVRQETAANDWSCPDCGTDNLAESRQCAKCGAKKRIGVSA